MVSELPTNQDHTAPLLAMLEFCESQLAYATALAMRIYGVALIAIGTIDSAQEWKEIAEISRDILADGLSLIKTESPELAAHAKQLLDAFIDGMDYEDLLAIMAEAAGDGA